MTESLGRWRVLEPVEAPRWAIACKVRRDAEVGVAWGLPVDDPRMSAFEREERLWQQLSLPRMARWRDGFEAEGKRWFVIDDVQGPTLTELVTRRRTGVNELLDRLDEILALVADVHARGVVLRTLGPDAMVVRPDGMWLVRLSGATDEPGADVDVGSFGYAAPELYAGEAAPAADIYAVGAIAAWMFTRKHPRALDARGKLDWRPHTKVPPEVADWVDALLHADPAKRPDATTARDQLLALRRRGFEHSLSTVPDQPPARSRRGWVVAVIGGLAALLLIGGLVLVAALAVSGVAVTTLLALLLALFAS